MNIKTDNQNYFYDISLNQRIARYDSTNENLELVVNIKSKVVRIKNSDIHVNIAGQIYFEYESVKYIVDDGYRNTLVRAGYIVMNNYDSDHLYDKKEGVKVRGNLLNTAKNVLKKYFELLGTCHSVEENQNGITIEFEENGFFYILCIDTINRIVGKNQQRKINQLPFYPFEKNMDKYGTLYLSIFCEQKKEVNDGNEGEKYNIIDSHISFLIDSMNNNENDGNNYKLNTVHNFKKINYCKGM